MDKGPGRRLSRLLGGSEALVVPGCYDAATARLVEAAGFAACYVSGATASALQLGLPDLGFAGIPEILDTVGQVKQGTSLPVIADADAGFGGPVQVQQAVRRYERAGISALHIEDQVNPKRCGHLTGVRLEDAETATSRIRLACQTRVDMVVIARTDAVRVEGLAAACERGRQYAAAGADAVFVEALSTAEQVRRACAEIGAPIVVSISEAGGLPALSPAAALAAGASIALVPVAGLLAALAAYRALLDALHTAGSAQGIDRMPWTEFTDLLGLPALDEQADRMTTDTQFST